MRTLFFISILVPCLALGGGLDVDHFSERYQQFLSSSSASNVNSRFHFLQLLDVYVVTEDRPNCLASVESNQVYCSDQEIVLSNPLFDFLYGDVGSFSFGQTPGGLQDINYPALVIKEGGLIDHCKARSLDINACAINVLAHEGFHMIVQIPDMMTWFSGSLGIEVPTIYTELSHLNSWPDWAHPQVEDRQQVVNECYPGEYGQSELTTLRTLLKLGLNQERVRALSLLSQFVDEREARYERLSSVRIRMLNGREPVSCRDADRIMELLEGTADFIGLHAEFELPESPSNLGSFIGSRRFEFIGEHEWYYRTGSSQLFALQILFPETHQNPILDLINSSSSLSGPTDLVKSALRNGSVRSLLKNMQEN